MHAAWHDSLRALLTFTCIPGAKIFSGCPERLGGVGQHHWGRSGEECAGRIRSRLPEAREARGGESGNSAPSCLRLSALQDSAWLQNRTLVQTEWNLFPHETRAWRNFRLLLMAWHAEGQPVASVASREWFPSYSQLDLGSIPPPFPMPSAQVWSEEQSLRGSGRGQARARDNRTRNREVQGLCLPVIESRFAECRLLARGTHHGGPADTHAAGCILLPESGGCTIPDHPSACLPGIRRCRAWGRSDFSPWKVRRGSLGEHGCQDN